MPNIETTTVPVVQPANDDHLLILDASDNNSVKRVSESGLMNFVAGGSADPYHFEHLVKDIATPNTTYEGTDFSQSSISISSTGEGLVMPFMLETSFPNQTLIRNRAFFTTPEGFITFKIAGVVGQTQPAVFEALLKTTHTSGGQNNAPIVTTARIDKKELVVGFEDVSLMSFGSVVKLDADAADGATTPAPPVKVEVVIRLFSTDGSTRVPGTLTELSYNKCGVFFHQLANKLGEQGPQGVAGQAGPQGPKGDTGDTGPQGETGATGAAGPKGDRGDEGPAGQAGATGPQGDPGQGVPAGGSAGQVLTKASGTDYDTNWQAPQGGGGTGIPANDSLGKNQLDFESGTNEGAGRAVTLTATDEFSTAVIPTPPSANQLVPTTGGGEGKVLTDHYNGSAVTPVWHEPVITVATRTTAFPQAVLRGNILVIQGGQDAGSYIAQGNQAQGENFANAAVTDFKLIPDPVVLPTELPPTNDSVDKTKIDFAAGTNQGAGRVLALTAGDELTTVAQSSGGGVPADDSIRVTQLDFVDGADESVNRVITIGANGEFGTAAQAAGGDGNWSQITANVTSLNSLTTTAHNGRGVWRDARSSYTNTPTGAGDGYVFEWRVDTNNRTQKYVDEANGNVWIRSRRGGTWENWIKQNLTPSEVTALGLAITKLQGIADGATVGATTAQAAAIAQNTEKHGLFNFGVTEIGTFLGVSGNPDQNTAIAHGTAQFDGGDLFISSFTSAGVVIPALESNSMVTTTFPANGGVNIGGLGGTVTSASLLGTGNARRVRIVVAWSGGVAPIANSGHKFHLYNVADPNVVQHGVHTDSTINGNGDPAAVLSVATPATNTDVTNLALNQGNLRLTRRSGATEDITLPTPSTTPADNSIGVAKLDFATGADESVGRVVTIAANGEFSTTAAGGGQNTGIGFSRDTLIASRSIADTNAEKLTFTLSLDAGKTLLGHDDFEVVFRYTHGVTVSGHVFQTHNRFAKIYDGEGLRSSGGGRSYYEEVFTVGSATNQVNFVLQRQSDTSIVISFVRNDGVTRTGSTIDEFALVGRSFGSINEVSGEPFPSFP